MKIAGVLLLGGILASIAAGCSSDGDDTVPGGGGSGGSGGKAGSAGTAGKGQAGATEGGAAQGGAPEGGAAQGGASEGGVAQGGASEGGAAGVSSTDQIARGLYIVAHVAACGDCHTPRDATGAPIPSKLLAGNAAFADLVPADTTMGLVPTPNLTPDMLTGLGTWTDEQIKNAFQNGLDADNKPLFSIMPYYVFHNMTDADADAVVAYLRSIPAVNNAIPERQPLGFPVTQALPVPAADIPDTTLPTTDENYASAERGRYLAGSIGICMECHSEHDATAAIPLKLGKLFQGNEPFTRDQLGLPPVFPATILSANITPAANGIAGWTSGDVIKVLHEGVNKNGAPLCPPMPFGPNGAFGGLTFGDATDIGNYITTLTPGDNGVIPFCVAPAPPGGGAGGAGGEGGGGS
jgi:mono/diheme cytochrome c family protein